MALTITHETLHNHVTSLRWIVLGSNPTSDGKLVHVVYLCPTGQLVELFFTNESEAKGKQLLAGIRGLRSYGDFPA